MLAIFLCVILFLFSCLIDVFCSLFCVLHFAYLVCCGDLARAAVFLIILLPLLALNFILMFDLNCAKLLLR